MLHIKKISLTLILIIAGFSTYKYLHSDHKKQTNDHTRKVFKKAMNMPSTDTNSKTTSSLPEPTYITTPSGLQYTIIKAASETAKQPQKGKKVTVHYTGYLDNKGELGKKFDSSVDRGTPFTFIIGIGQVIAGWDEGVITMRVGEKRRLIIPAQLGYGSRGAGNIIPGGATLIFDVELLTTE